LAKSPLKSGLAAGFDYSRLDILPWAESRIYLPRSVSPTQYGPFSSLNAPWQIEPLQEIANDENESVILIKANGVGGSTIGTVSLCYFIDQDPGAAIWVSATEKLIRDYSKDTLFPILRNVSGISEDDLNDRTKSSLFEVRLPAMTLLLAWGGSEASAEQKHVRFIYLDEFELYADLVGRFEARTTRQFNSRKVYITKPRMTGGISHEKYRLTDQREWHFPCLKCDAPLPLKFKGHIAFEKFYYDDQRPDWGKIFPTIRYVCPHCSHEHFESDELHTHIINLARSRWIPQYPRANEGLARKFVGFRWNSMLLHRIDGVPSWQKLVQEFVEAEISFTNHGIVQPLQDFIAKRLGEWWSVGDEHAKKDPTLSAYSIKDPISKDWDEIALTVDVQETHFWFTKFGWKHDGTARLIDCGKLLGEDEIMRKAEGLRGPQFVFLDAAWSPGRRVQKICAAHNWTALVGTDRDGFDHITNRKDHRGNPITVRKIYSREKRIDVGMGTRQAGRMFCAQYDFASNVAEGMLQERLDRKDLKFEIPDDAPQELLEHLKGMVYKPVVNKSTGEKKWIWAEVAPPHLRDCCKMQIVFASMAKCITVELPDIETPHGQDR
jgi:hypothetical protein